MVVVNEGGTIVLCNSKLATTFGYTQEELLGQNVDMLVPDDIRPQHPQNRANFMTSRGYHAVETGLELRGRHKNGTVFPAEFGMSACCTPAPNTSCRCTLPSATSTPKTSNALPRAPTGPIGVQHPDDAQGRGRHGGASASLVHSDGLQRSTVHIDPVF